MNSGKRLLPTFSYYPESKLSCGLRGPLGMALRFAWRRRKRLRQVKAVGYETISSLLAHALPI